MSLLEPATRDRLANLQQHFTSHGFRSPGTKARTWDPIKSHNSPMLPRLIIRTAPLCPGHDYERRPPSCGCLFLLCCFLFCPAPSCDSRSIACADFVRRIFIPIAAQVEDFTALIFLKLLVAGDPTAYYPPAITPSFPTDAAPREQSSVSSLKPSIAITRNPAST
jgi:hypothetical protein